MLYLLLAGCLLYDRAYYETALLRFEDNDGDKWSEAQGDCDDTRSEVNPWQDEYCNGLDDDCNDLVDDFPLDIRVWYPDVDADSFGSDAENVHVLTCEAPAGYVAANGDCDDTNPLAFTGAGEECADSSDLDCDGYAGNADRDGDGSIDCDDCEMTNAAIYPGAPEICNDDDDDCDGEYDEADAVDALPWYEDADNDGYGAGEPVYKCESPGLFSNVGGDCDDHASGVHPGADEVCLDGVDDNCDGIGDGCRVEGEIEPWARVVPPSGNGVAPGPRVGDLTGDGIDDFVVLRTIDGGGGGVSLLGPLSSGNQDELSVTLETSNAPDEGYTTSWLVVMGDIEGDSYQEWIVGGGSGISVMTSYLLGEPEIAPLARANFTYTPWVYGGVSHDAPGDLQNLGGTGGADLLLGAPTDEPAAVNGGVIVGFYEPSGTYDNGDEDLRLLGDEAELGLGVGVASGDFDGDGLLDIAAGSANTIDGYEVTGELLIFNGPFPSDRNASDADARLRGEYESYCTNELMAPGDVSGDGRDDLWVQAPWDNLGEYEGGALYLMTELRDSEPIRGAAAASIAGEVSYSYLGSQGMVSEDMDNDGAADLITASREYGPVRGDFQGRVYVFYGPASGSISAADADFTYTGDNGAYAGSTFSVPGDLDGDGNLELAWIETTELAPLYGISVFFGQSY